MFQSRHLVFRFKRVISTKLHTVKVVGIKVYDPFRQVWMSPAQGRQLGFRAPASSQSHSAPRVF